MNPQADAVTAERMRVLAALTEALGTDDALTTGNLDAAAARIAHAALAVLDSDRASVWTLDVAGSSLQCRALADRHDADSPLPPPLSRDVHAALFAALAAPTGERAQPQGDTRCLDCALHLHGTPAGMLRVERGSAHPWRASERALLHMLAGIASLALAGAANHATGEAAAAALREQQARLDLILGHADAVIFTLDPRGRFEYVSPSVRQYTQTKPDEVVGNDWQSLVHPDDKPRLVQEVSRLFAGSAERVLLDYRVPDDRAAGEWRVLSAAITLMRAADGRRRVVGSAIDVTAVRAAADQRIAFARQLEQAQRHQSLGRLAGGIAHEFNNLLTIVLGGADLLLLQASAEGRDTGVLTSLREATLRASRYTRQLLAFSGRQLLDLQRMDVAEVVDELLPLLRASIPASIRVGLQVEGSLPSVLADRAALEQALLELALRAVNGMASEGEVALGIDVQVNEQPRTLRGGELPRGQFVRVCISDTGPPLTELQLRQKFEPFTELRGRDDPLAIERQLRLAAAIGSVQQQHGVVDAVVDALVDAAVTAGDAAATTAANDLVQAGGDARAAEEAAPHAAAVTPGVHFTNRFLIYLPVHDDDDVARESSSHEHAAAGTRQADVHATANAARVLVVEDEPDVLQLALLILRGAGYAAEGAQDVATAVHRVEEAHAHFDLLVTDVVMPGLDGVRLYERLRRAAPGLRVLYMSGYAPDDLPTRVAPGAITSYLQKPFSLQQLRTKVHEVLHA